MKEEQYRFLSLLGQLPARLTAEQAAWVLNCQVHDVPVLVAARLLKPLGNPPPSSVKFFATLEVLELAKDRTLAGEDDKRCESILATKESAQEKSFAGCGSTANQFASVDRDLIARARLKDLNRFK